MTIAAVDPSSRRALVFTPMETRREVLVEAAVLAERLGYEAVVVPEGWSLDSSIVLTEIALRTSRIRLVSGILSIWGRTAATMAMTAATLDEMSGDRFTLGLGASTAVLAERFHAVPFAAPAEKLEQVLTQVRTLLAGQRGTGSNGSGGLRLGQPSRPDLPIWVAGLGPKAVKTAATLADGWFPMAVVRDSIEQRRRAAAAKYNGHCELITGPMAAVDSTTASGRDVVAQLAGWYMTGMGPFYGDTAAASGFADQVKALRAANPKPVPGRMVWPEQSDTLLEQLVVFGDASAVATQLLVWDTLADVVAVVVGPDSSQMIMSTIEAAAPPGR